MDQFVYRPHGDATGGAKVSLHCEQLPAEEIARLAVSAERYRWNARRHRAGLTLSERS